MEAEELKAIWKTHDSRLEKSLALNKRCITELQTQKSVSALAPLKRNRMLEIAFVLSFLVYSFMKIVRPGILFFLLQL